MFNATGLSATRGRDVASKPLLLEFPGVVHHYNEVLVVIDGRTDAAVVVDELLLGYLTTSAHLDTDSIIHPLVN